jgi:hypothetical protein
VWSGFATVAYLVRPYQVVRTRRTLVASRKVAVAPAAAVSQNISDVRLAPGKAVS